MSVTTPFEPIAGLFERNLSIRHVYAEPVQHGDTTIIPVAKVAYGFGAGGGRRRSADTDWSVGNRAPCSAAGSAEARTETRCASSA